MKRLDQFSEVTEPDKSSAHPWPPPIPSSPQSPPPSRTWLPWMVTLGLLMLAGTGFALGLLASTFLPVALHPGPTPQRSLAPAATPHLTSARPLTPAVTPRPASTLARATCPEQVAINDAAGVLDAAHVCEEAALLSYPISIYTSTTYTGGAGDFDQQVQALITSPRMIVLAIDIDTTHQRAHVAIFGGIAVPLADHQYHDAVDAFNHNFATSNDYTGATVAALRSLRSSLESSEEE